MKRVHMHMCTQTAMNTVAVTEIWQMLFGACCCAIVPVLGFICVAPWCERNEHV